jgi:hypothetical protein
MQPCMHMHCTTQLEVVSVLQPGRSNLQSQLVWSHNKHVTNSCIATYRAESAHRLLLSERVLQKQWGAFPNSSNTLMCNLSCARHAHVACIDACKSHTDSRRLCEEKTFRIPSCSHAEHDSGAARGTANWLASCPFPAL